MICEYFATFRSSHIVFVEYAPTFVNSCPKTVQKYQKKKTMVSHPFPFSFFLNTTALSHALVVPLQTCHLRRAWCKGGRMVSTGVVGMLHMPLFPASLANIIAVNLPFISEALTLYGRNIQDNLPRWATLPC